MPSSPGNDTPVYAVIEAEAVLGGSGDITVADLRSVLALAAALAGSGTLTALISGAVNAQAMLGGSGSLVADLNAIVAASATLSGSGALTSGLLALGNLSAVLAGLGDLDGTMRADGELSATINVANSDPLSPDALAAAVWNALVLEFGNPGTFGELVQNNVGVDYDRIMREIRDALVPHIWGSS